MDASVPSITFDSEGRCNYCSEFLGRAHTILFATPEQRHTRRSAFIEQVKAAGRGRRYDCIVGISGGVDSSWVLHQTQELGLRPLAAHMDNGWNSELAQHNIEQLLKRLDVDLTTHVIDWREYRGLMQAFFDADVVDVELLYDNAAHAVCYRAAAEHGVQYILTGSNQATEGIRIPPGWNHFKRDRRNILGIWRRFGNGRPLRSFPAIGTIQYLYYSYLRSIQWSDFIDYFEFDKQKALDLLTERYAYKPYPYKHYESVFTRFYQGYILPKKFGIDKRRMHLSTLVATGQMTREDALAHLERSPYPSEEALQQDIVYFLKKMRWTQAQLDAYLARPGKPHAMYGSEKLLYNVLAPATRRLVGR
jgi:N-acetyl sugar amidotransferase